MKHIFPLTCIFAWVVLGSLPTQGQFLLSQSDFSSEGKTSSPPLGNPGVPQGPPIVDRGCSDQLLAFVKVQSGQFMGFTRQERPIFWVYLPYEEAQIVNDKIELRLRDREGVTQYIAEFDLNVENPRVLGIPLPADAPPLVLNQQYEWHVSVEVDCREGTKYATQGVSAWAIRADVTNEIPEEDFIYDRLTAIAQSENPEERQQQWLQFLQFLNLEQYQETLKDECCTILNPSTPISYQ